MAHEEFWRGVVFGAAARVEEGGGRGLWDVAGETEVCEGNEGGGVRERGGDGGEEGGGDVDEDV